jgi:hypothetical protein
MTATTEPATLPLVRAADLEEPDDARRWLVDPIVPRTGVSICGGAPKSCKSWLGLDLALSVASGTPCLDRFAVAEPGSALIYLAEDPPPLVRTRLAGLCRHRGLDLRTLPIDVITAPSLRLDLARDQDRLAETIRQQAPRLLLLDPFIRLHRINENDCGEVSALLAYLRELERRFDLAIMVVHHARKNGTSSAQAGQGLRGSSDFYAFVDTLLYLRRHREQLALSVEHRAAQAPPVLELALFAGANDDTHLQIVDGISPAALSGASRPGFRNLDAAVLRLLDERCAPLSRTALRGLLHCRMEILDDSLARLAETGQIAQNDDQWARAPRTPTEENCARAPGAGNGVTPP